jgi:ubiquitin C-terminal hydrolase
MNNKILYQSELDNYQPCVVENGLNTCYIDSLIVALFYKDVNYTNYILETMPKKLEGIYLQELIKNKLILPIQKNYSINSSIINEIRNYSVICGWSPDGDITDQKDCSEFYIFLMELFNISPLEFEILEFKNNTLTNNIQKLSYPFITLYPNKDDTIKNLIQYWINSKIYSPDENIMYCYKLTTIPQFILLHINRFNNDTRQQYKIDIMKRIKFFGINDQTQNFIKWKIHAIICHNGNNMKSGHYYCITTTYDKKWLLFDNMIIPSFQQIDLENEDIKEKIMLESVILIYTLDE